ncbi:hypothetical protein PROFUN_11627, partial [Planoprotostelium fungivorum]
RSKPPAEENVNPSRSHYAPISPNGVNLNNTDARAMSPPAARPGISKPPHAMTSRPSMEKSLPPRQNPPTSNVNGRTMSPPPVRPTEAFVDTQKNVDSRTMSPPPVRPTEAVQQNNDIQDIDIRTVSPNRPGPIYNASLVQSDHRNKPPSTASAYAPIPMSIRNLEENSTPQKKQHYSPFPNAPPTQAEQRTLSPPPHRPLGNVDKPMSREDSHYAAIPSMSNVNIADGRKMSPPPLRPAEPDLHYVNSPARGNVNNVDTRTLSPPPLRPDNKKDEPAPSPYGVMPRSALNNVDNRTLSPPPGRPNEGKMAISTPYGVIPLKSGNNVDNRPTSPVSRLPIDPPRPNKEASSHYGAFPSMSNLNNVDNRTLSPPPNRPVNNVDGRTLSPPPNRPVNNVDNRTLSPPPSRPGPSDSNRALSPPPNRDHRLEPPPLRSAFADSRTLTREDKGIRAPPASLNEHWGENMQGQKMAGTGIELPPSPSYAKPHTAITSVASGKRSSDEDTDGSGISLPDVDDDQEKSSPSTLKSNVQSAEIPTKQHSWRLERSPGGSRENSPKTQFLKLSGTKSFKPLVTNSRGGVAQQSASMTDKVRSISEKKDSKEKLDSVVGSFTLAADSPLQRTTGFTVPPSGGNAERDWAPPLVGGHKKERPQGVRDQQLPEQVSGYKGSVVEEDNSPTSLRWSNAQPALRLKARSSNAAFVLRGLVARLQPCTADAVVTHSDNTGQSRVDLLTSTDIVELREASHGWEGLGNLLRLSLSHILHEDNSKTPLETRRRILYLYGCSAGCSERVSLQKMSDSVLKVEHGVVIACEHREPNEWQKGTDGSRMTREGSDAHSIECPYLHCLVWLPDAIRPLLRWTT